MKTILGVNAVGSGQISYHVMGQAGQYAGRSALSKSGIARKRRGEGFAYYGTDGDVLSDPGTLQRIKELVIPPA